MMVSDFVVHYVLKEYRPVQDSSEFSDEDDVVSVTFVRERFMHVIPSFDIIAVELRHVRD